MAGRSGVQHLSEEEISEFVKDLDPDNEGCIAYHKVEQALDNVYEEISPKPTQGNDARHIFLRSVLAEKDHIPVDEFKSRVREWKIPSMEREKQAEKESDEYKKRMGNYRRLRAYWMVRGPTVGFLVMVVSMQVACGVWQLVKFLIMEKYRHAFGWGAVMAKTCAGALYPTIFFLILSMSRYISTIARRRSYWVSRFINWDLSQSFHIKISIIALILSSLHAIGHLTGTFLYGSRPAQRNDVEALLGPDFALKSYGSYVRSIPGWSGIVSLLMFYILAVLSMPKVRRWSYELFQGGHLLMFPMIGLWMAHGTLGFLQRPIFGYILAFPTFLVVLERVHRVIVGFSRISAKMQLLDNETVTLTVPIPTRPYWMYEAGQYVFLQVPQLSLWQWHPFTISMVVDNKIKLHIKTDGDWGSQLAGLCRGNGEVVDLKVGIDGPLGAPAQRFYDFQHHIVLGSGIGITPFSGILADLKANELKRERERENENENENEKPRRHSGTSFRIDKKNARYRRVDFHWIVKDKNYLLWFSDLLNRITSAPPNSKLDIRIHTYVTQTRKAISSYIYRALLERNRTEEQPTSPITGLLNQTRFGRPDLARILDQHYESMKTTKREVLKVGVFFCGAHALAVELADRCHVLNLRAREDGTEVQYYFMMEVFG